MLVPNGGFETLQESLITKQLAHLITPRDDTRPPIPSARPAKGNNELCLFPPTRLQSEHQGVGNTVFLLNSP